MHSLTAIEGWKLKRVDNALQMLSSEQEAAKYRIPTIRLVNNEPEGILPNGKRPEFEVTFQGSDESVLICVMAKIRRRVSRRSVRATIRSLYGDVRNLNKRIVTLIIYGKERLPDLLRKVSDCIRTALNASKRLSDWDRAMRRRDKERTAIISAPRFQRSMRCAA